MDQYILDVPLTMLYFDLVDLVNLIEEFGSEEVKFYLDNLKDILSKATTPEEKVHETKMKMRYFIVFGRVFLTNEMKFAFGTCLVEQEEYPSRKTIEEEFLEDCKGVYDRCDIMNIVEVSKEDLKNFNK